MTLIVSAIAIYRKSDGALQYVAPVDLKPADPAMAWSALPVGYGDDTHVWSAASRQMVEDRAKVSAKLIAAIKAEAEVRKMRLLTAGGAKKTEYSDQAAEVRFFWSLGGSVTAILGAIGLWSSDRRAAVFPCAAANAAEFGDTIDKAIGRFSAGMKKSASKEKIAAVEARVCAAIEAASTAAAARAAAAAIVWP
ncbi:hypothetical protein [Sphingomonas adhaesiva]|uniref:hypothetical protein n=1 Tax=Sphingomonas adhaesiva TaxID=28212 RepID=UPI002FFAC208